MFECQLNHLNKISQKCYRLNVWKGTLFKVSSLTWAFRPLHAYIMQRHMTSFRCITLITWSGLVAWELPLMAREKEGQGEQMVEQGHTYTYTHTNALTHTHTHTHTRVSGITVWLTLRLWTKDLQCESTSIVLFSVTVSSRNVKLTGLFTHNRYQRVQRGHQLHSLEPMYKKKKKKEQEKKRAKRETGGGKIADWVFISN